MMLKVKICEDSLKNDAGSQKKVKTVKDSEKSTSL